MEETQTQTRDYSGVSTAQIVDEMLKENCGTHFLDSGGAYGRHWQRNQGRDFEAEPAVRYEWSTWRREGHRFGEPSLCATVSLYHWMNHYLELDAELQERLDRFVAEEAQDGWSWLQVQEEFADKLFELGELDGRPNVVNTYNWTDTCDLSQVLQYVELRLDGEYDTSHLIVSVHGGCDVRGGYGAPKVFRLRREYHEAIDGMQVRYLGLSGDFASWYGDGGYFSSAEPGDRNGGVSEDLQCDILKLPCSKVEWVAEECQEVADVLAAIERCEKDADALDGTTLRPEQILEARATMARSKPELEEKALHKALDWLYGELDGPGLIAHDNELHIVFMKDGALTYDTVEASADFS